MAISLDTNGVGGGVDSVVYAVHSVPITEERKPFIQETPQPILQHTGMFDLLLIISTTL